MSQHTVTLDTANDFLTQHLGTAPDSLALIGAGAWSQCFAFRAANQDWVIRFGNHVDDFQKDHRAHAYATAALPIPQVTAIGNAFDGYYAISSRVFGAPLEDANAAQWQALVPALADVLEALRTADISLSTGWGGWDGAGRANGTSWAEHLLLVDYDGPDRRTYGWHDKLAKHPYGADTFAWGMAQLRSMAHIDVPRNLLHCDLINRNAYFVANKITGVFDWGCGLYGDHLYELAWFEFWSAWYPDMHMALLHQALAERWQASGYAPDNKAARLMACCLHIGLDHLAYNAHTGNIASLVAVADRMRTIEGIS